MSAGYSLNPTRWINSRFFPFIKRLTKDSENINMKNIFIELTNTDNEKILLNVLHIAYVEPYKGGSIIKSNLVNYTFPTKVKESYDEVKKLIGALNSSE
jgi:hypothetical protein